LVLYLSDYNDQLITEIESLYQRTEYKEAYDKVQSAIESSQKNTSDYYSLLIWEIKLKPTIGNYSNLFNQIDNISQKIEDLGFRELYLDACLVKIHFLELYSLFDDLIVTIEKAELDLQKNIVKNKSYYENIIEYYKGKYYSYKGNNKKAKQIYEKVLKEFKKMKMKFYEAETLNSLASIYRRLSDLEASKRICNRALKIITDEGFKQIKSKIYSQLGFIFQHKGDLVEALSYHQKALDLSNKIKMPHLLGNTNINIGALNHFRGELNAALSYYQKALDNYLIVGNKLSIAATQYNIALIYNLQGKLKEAMEKFESGLVIFQEIGNISLITACLNSLGKILCDFGLFNEAEQRLLSVYKQKSYMTNIAFSKTLFYLIPVLLIQNKFTQAQQLLLDLENNDKREDITTINHRYLVLKGLIESYNEKYSFSEIEKLYVKVISEPISDRETTTEAIILYTHLLINEYKQNNKPEILEIIKYYSERLSKLATKQQSKLLFTEHFWLKSIIASLENDQETANELLEQTKKMAKEMNFIRLLIKINN
jgi:tetratricopeptide (TPR) repeat protein